MKNRRRMDMKALEGLLDMDQEDLLESVERVEEMTALARSMVPVVGEFLKRNSDILVDTLGAVMDVLMDADKLLEKRFDRWSAMSAKGKMRNLKALMGVGFTREEATMFLLSDMVRSREAVKNLLKTRINTSSDKKGSTVQT